MLLIVFGLFVLAASAIFVLLATEALPAERVPTPLRPALERLQALCKILDAKLNEAAEAARADFEAEKNGGQPSLAQLLAPPLNPDGPPVPLAMLAAQHLAAAPKQAAAPVEPESDSAFFLLELESNCRFVPELHGNEALVSRRQYRMLVGYYAFAFDKVYTPEAAFARVGLNLRVQKAR